MKHLISLRTLAPALVLALLAFTVTGCPDDTGQLCPAGTQQAGVFNTSLTFNSNDPQQCYYSLDGGVPDASLAATGPDAGPDTFTSAICSGFDVDGGPLIYFAVPALVRYGTPGDAGAFFFETQSLVTGTACGCDIYVTEQINGTLTPLAAGGSVQIDADGGLPPLGGFTGTVVDQIDNVDAGNDPTPSTATCSCNLPCDLQYTLAGTPF